jgi:hypothetical protein
VKNRDKKISENPSYSDSNRNSYGGLCTFV